MVEQLGHCGQIRQSKVDGRIDQMDELEEALEIGRHRHRTIQCQLHQRAPMTVTFCSSFLFLFLLLQQFILQCQKGICPRSDDVIISIRRRTRRRRAGRTRRRAGK